MWKNENGIGRLSLSSVPFSLCMYGLVCVCVVVYTVKNKSVKFGLYSCFWDK